MAILTTVLSISLISSALAFIIIIAEKYLNDYGECEIDINNGDRVLKVTGGSSLLSSLASQEIYIPSACGGKATCGMCKICIMEGAGPLLPTEEPYLSKEEIKEGKRLSCQIKVKNNLKIFIPEELFSVKQFKARVEKLEQLTHDIKGLRLVLLSPGEIKFKAGQYIQFYSKPYNKVKESVYRAYSISSSPSDKNALELVIRQVPEGICTTYVHTQLKEGDEITLSGPYGDFYLRGKGKDLIFIAGGSGLAPIKSLVLDILEKKLDMKMTFFFGASTLKDLYYLDYFHKLEAEHENFKFIPSLSRPAESENWKGETGRITNIIDRYIADSVNKEAYLCGSPSLINACVNVLKNKGFTDDIIFYDKF